jgi:hypothetical protein
MSLAKRIFFDAVMTSMYNCHIIDYIAHICRSHVHLKTNFLRQS